MFGFHNNNNNKKYELNKLKLHGTLTWWFNTLCVWIDALLLIVHLFWYLWWIVCFDRHTGCIVIYTTNSQWRKCNIFYDLFILTFGSAIKKQKIFEWMLCVSMKWTKKQLFVTIDFCLLSKKIISIHFIFISSAVIFVFISLCVCVCVCEPV